MKMSHQERIQLALGSYLSRNSKGQKMILGNYELVRHDQKVFIRDLKTLEAGTFPLAEVAALIAKYFKEHF